MKKRIAILSVIALVLIIVAVLFVAGDYLYNLALNPDSNKSAVFNNESTQLEPQAESPGDGTRESTAELLEWAKGIYTSWSMQSYDNLKLNAYFYDNSAQSNRYAIVVHGYTSNGLDMVHGAKRFYENGFSVLAVDCRGHGKSEGSYIGMGWHDRLDIVSWIGKILEKDETAEIVLYGISMGGATVMMTAGEPLPPNVKCIVEDCGYSSVEDIFTYQLKSIFNLPKFPVIYAASLVTQIRAGYSFGEASALKQLAKCQTPIFFIHGDDDKFVPYSMLDIVYNSANCEKEKFVVKGAGHGMASRVAGKEYWDRVFAFVDKYLH